MRRSATIQPPEFRRPPCASQCVDACREGATLRGDEPAAQHRTLGAVLCCAAPNNGDLRPAIDYRTSHSGPDDWLRQACLSGRRHGRDAEPDHPGPSADILKEAGPIETRTLPVAAEQGNGGSDITSNPRVYFKGLRTQSKQPRRT